MKKTIINAGLFALGYLLIALAIVGSYVNCDIWIHFSQNVSTHLEFWFLILSTCIALIGIAVFSWYGLKLLKQALDETVSAWMVLKEGQMVHVLRKDTYNRIITVSLYPFNGSRIEKIRRNSIKNKYESRLDNNKEEPIQEGFRYYFDKGYLRSVIE